MSNFPPGWYPNPHNPQKLSWWDGQQWTNHTAPKNTSLPDPTPSQLPSQSSNKNKTVLNVLRAILGAFLVLFIIGAYLIIESTGVFNRLSDAQVNRIEKQLSNPNNNLLVNVRVSGTSCEQLCQEIIINVTLPEDSNKYSAEDLNYVVSNIPVALTKAGSKENSVSLCFDTPNDMWAINFNDNELSQEEKVLTDRLNKIGVPHPSYGNEDEGGYSFINGCMYLTVKDIQ